MGIARRRLRQKSESDSVRTGAIRSHGKEEVGNSSSLHFNSVRRL